MKVGLFTESTELSFGSWIERDWYLIPVVLSQLLSYTRLLLPQSFCSSHVQHCVARLCSRIVAQNAVLFEQYTN